ncbi:MAG TPA: S8 family peptidase [Symbiobacteriaceae bacterium]|jgi:thermitase|nr:S8 family peptidase [Symbiobacteriaceae bacterium]
MKRSRTALALLLSLLLFGSLAAPAAGTGAPDTIAAPHAAGTVLLEFNEGTPASDRAAVMAAFSLTETGRVWGTDVVVAQGKGRSTSALVEALNKNPHVAYAEPDYTATALWTPNDPGFAQQWNLKKISAEPAWDVTRGSSAVMIAIVDTGIDLDHPDLAAKIRTDLDYDFVNSDSTAQDDNGHGTHLAGIAAAITNNGIGVAGLCPNCSLLPVKVLSASGSGTYSAVASGIRYAADKGAKVINLSLGGGSGSTTLLDAVQYAYAKGVTLTCAAGGSNSSTPSYPAYYSECVAVAASDLSDNKASFSTYGTWVDTTAPGVNIYSTYYDNTYATLSGTSMAAAHVAGLAGLLYSQGRTQADVRTRLTASTYTDPVNSTLIPRRINAYKAVAL